MSIENFIEGQYRAIDKTYGSEFLPVYNNISHEKLRLTFGQLHSEFIRIFKLMNERLPTNDQGAHFWAQESRELINSIEIALTLYESLKKTPFAFEIDDYYMKLFAKCNSFLSNSGGSLLPINMDKITLYYIDPIFKMSDVITHNSVNNSSYTLKFIGEGSFAQVFKYKDENYDKSIIVKRAKKNLNDKELIRFKQEFYAMKSCNSPYVVEVFKYNEDKKEYLMEYMDSTLRDYIGNNNSEISFKQRKRIGNQILAAFTYIHSKGLLHRDISPENILVKKYDDLIIVKIADFGLVKKFDSNLTAVDSDFKGHFNDPALATEGFNNYTLVHEIYAITKILFFVLTGKTNVSNIKNNNIEKFVHRGLNVDKTKRFSNFEILKSEFNGIA